MGILKTIGRLSLSVILKILLSTFTNRHLLNYTLSQFICYAMLDILLKCSIHICSVIIYQCIVVE